MSPTLQEAKRRHAVVLASKEVPQREIGKQLGVSQTQISRWLSDPESKRLLARIRERADDAVVDQAVADKVRRILKAQEMVDGIEELLASRRAAGSATPPSDRLPGEETGQLSIRRKTTTQTTRAGTTVIVELEGAFDAQIHIQLRSWQEYVAKELHQLQQTTRVLHSGTIRNTHFNIGDLSEDELVKLEEIRRRVEAPTQ